MKYIRAIEYVISELKENLPVHLTYHSLHHTLSVMELTKQIGLKEGVEGDDMELLMVASAYHDCGFLNGMDNHEELGCEVVARILPDFGFDKSEIKIIQGMIMATRLPQTPKTFLEKIICDADLGYIGGNKYFEIVSGLEKELLANGIPLTKDSWLDMQINFLKTQHFFTAYAVETFDENKCLVLSQLESKKAS